MAKMEEARLANTFCELETERATAKPTESGAWQLTLDVKARKVVVDEAGVETEVPIEVSDVRHRRCPAYASVVG